MTYCGLFIVCHGNDARKVSRSLCVLTSFLGSEGDGVPDAVVAARGAGIRVVMITGDYLLTAIAIAKNASCLRFAGVMFI